MVNRMRLASTLSTAQRASAQSFSVSGYTNSMSSGLTYLDEGRGAVILQTVVDRHP